MAWVKYRRTGSSQLDKAEASNTPLGSIDAGGWRGRRFVMSAFMTGGPIWGVSRPWAR
jgi:hypothetical protein